MLILFTLFMGLVFIFTAWFVFYVIGFGVLNLSKKRLEDTEIITLSLALGVVIFVMVAVILGLLHLRWFVLPVTLLAIFYVVIKNKFQLISPWKILVQDKKLLLLIILGIIIQGFINFPSGYLYENGLLFWSSQGHDGLWHVASMERVIKSFPP